MSSSASADSLNPNRNTSLPSSTISETEPNRIINAFNPLTHETNDRRSVLKILMRYIMRTFYDIPTSLVVEYIYHYECINQKDLAKLLCLDPQKINSYIQEFKRDKFIIEERRCELNVGTKSEPKPDELYYQIDIERFVNVVKYRLINMQSIVEKFEQEQTNKQVYYECEQCVKGYTEWDFGTLYKNSKEGDLICIACGNTLNDINQSDEATRENGKIVDMRLFNEQMTPLFQILQRIDEIMKNDQS
jgi:transcription initiation factor IIE alpha subunit